MNIKLRTVCFAFAGILLFCLNGFAESGVLKIGYVDINKVFEAYDKAHGIKELVKAEREKTRKEYVEREQEINKLNTEFRQRAAILDDKKKEKLKKDIQKKIEELIKYERERKGKEQEHISNALEKIYKAVDDVGEKEKFDIIIEKRTGVFGKTVLFAKKSLSLTDKVIKEVLKKK